MSQPAQPLLLDTATIPPPDPPAGRTSPLSRHRGSSLRPAPKREPRFDDELPARHLALVGRDALPLPFTDPVPLIADASAPGSSAHDDRRAELLGGLPEPVRFGRYYVQALLEVLSGRRPAAQLNRHTSTRVLAGLAQQHPRGTRFDTGGRNPVVHSVHVMEPAGRVAEISAVVQIGTRYRAIAVRLEAHHGQWRCVRLQVG